MARIPTEDMFVQSVLPHGQQDYLNVHANPESFGGQVGQTLGQAGNELAQHALARQQFINETNVNDVYSNQFSPAFRQLRENYLKLEGKDAETQFGSYETQINNLRNQYRDNLPNDVQRKMFDQQATQRIQMEMDGMARYAAQQSKSWELKTHQATIDNLISEAEGNYNDPKYLQDVQNRIDEQMISYGSSHGWSEPIYRAQRIDAIDKLWESIIKRQAISGNVAGALQTYQDQLKIPQRLSGQSQGKIESFLRPYKENFDAQRAFGIATGGPIAFQIVSQASAQGVDPNTALTVWSCEGGVVNPQVTNPKSSATGHFQIIDSTWVGLGGQPEERFDSNKQVELGIKNIKDSTDYLQKVLGRQPQPWEIYLAHQQGAGGAERLLSADPNANAGQVVGNPKAIIGNMKGATTETTVGDFLNYIHGYVAKHSMMYDPQGLPTADNVAENYEQSLQDVTAQAVRDYPNDPSMIDKYRNYYTSHAGQLLQAQKMADNQNWKVINNALTGPQGYQSRDEFMADPAVKAAYDAIYARDHSVADKVDGIFVTKNLAQWNPDPTPESDNLYGSLMGFAREDPKGFSAMDLPPYYGAMPESQFNKLVARKEKILDKDETESQKSVKISTVVSNSKDIVSQAQNRMYKDQTEYFGLNPSGSRDGQLKYYKFLNEIESDIDAFESEKRRPPNYKEQREMVMDRLFPQGIKEPQQTGTTTTKTNTQTQAEKPDPKIADRIKQLGDQYTPEEISTFLKAKGVKPELYGLPK